MNEPSKTLRNFGYVSCTLGILSIVACVTLAILACWSHGDAPERLIGTAAIAFFTGVVLVAVGIFAVDDPR